MFSVFLQSPLILDSEEVKEALNKSPSEKTNDFKKSLALIY
jgi:hypothetical protein